MKKILLTIAVVIISAFISINSANAFEIKNTDIELLRTKLILSDSEGKEAFSSKKILTRGEAITWILKSADLPLEEEPDYIEGVGYTDTLEGYDFYFEKALNRKVGPDFDLEKSIEQDLFFEFLFRAHQFISKKEQFLDQKLLSKNKEKPFLAYADLLNLKRKTKTLNHGQALQILAQFLEQKKWIIFDQYLGKIASHEHYRKKSPLEKYLAITGVLGIQKTVFLPTGRGSDNRGYEVHQKDLLKKQKTHQKKIIAFCTLDESDPNGAKKIEKCIKKGGKGLKLLGGHPALYDEPLNSEKMMRVYKVAENHKIPVLFHGSIINIPEMENQIRDFVQEFPAVVFIHAHYCSAIMKGVNLERCAKLLDDFGNLYVDISMGHGIKDLIKYLQNDIDRQKIEDFILKYQDRLLYSSDIIVLPKDTPERIYSRMVCDIQILQQEKAICPEYNPTEKVTGLNLPEEVLRKLYFENAEKIFGL